MNCPQDHKTFLEWFVHSSFREYELLKEGTSKDCSDWLPAVCAWFFERLPQSRRKRFVDRLPNGHKRYEKIRGTTTRIYSDYVPFPLARQGVEPCVDTAQLAFIGVSSSKNAKFIDTTDGESQKNAVYAAEYVYNVFRKFDKDVGYPEIHLHASGTLDGGSLMLSAMIAALCCILDMDISDDLIATGALGKNEDEEYELQTIGSNTLPQKICAAVRYGYRKFLFVEGQRGCWQNQDGYSPAAICKILKREKAIPEDAELEFIPLPKNPLHALWEILQLLGVQNDSNEKKLAEFLVVLGYQPFRKEAQFYQILQAHSESSSQLVRHVAMDLRRRIDVDNGNADDWITNEIPRLEPKDFPFGPLGSYLKYEEISTHVVMNLDNGIWSEDEPNYLYSQEILQWKEQCIKMGIADFEDLRVALFLSNHIARHRLFHGKLNQDAQLIEQAWHGLIRFQPYWSDVFQYTEQQGRRLETPQLQRNLCVECLESYWNLTQKTLEPFPKASDFLSDMSEYNAYDLTAWLRWRVMLHGQAISAEDIECCLARADEIYQNPDVEDYKPYEKILQYGLGTDNQRAHAREQLKRARHLTDRDLQTGILGILAMRTAYILGDESMWKSAHDNVNDLLKWLADELEKEPEKITIRCPY